MDHHILCAYEFDGTGQGVPLQDADISRKLQADTLAWVHLDANAAATRTWLQQEVGYLDPWIIEALLAEETRPRMTPVGDGVLLILRGVNLNDNADPEDMVSIRLWVDGHRIISMRKRKLKAVDDIRQKLESGRGPKTAGDFVCMLCARLFERMEPVIGDLNDITDHIEEDVLEQADGRLRESIVNVRKQAIVFRRYMSPQRDAIAQLRLTDMPWLSEQHGRSLQESINHVTRFVEDLDSVRERAQVVKDELANSLAEKLNKNLYVLAVISAVFLPLGFLTGLLGINVGGMPGADDRSAFWLVCAMLMMIVVAQVVLFRRFRLF